MTGKISNQMLCTIGENLVSAQLMAHGWPTSNANSSISNFKGIDLFCQRGVDSDNIIGIQVKASMENSFLVGLSCKDAIKRSELEKRIIGPWVFVKIKSLIPLKADFYVISRVQMLELLITSHEWYLNQWKRTPSAKLLDSPAALKLSWLQGLNDDSTKALSPYNNPYVGINFADKWDYIWA